MVRALSIHVELNTDGTRDPGQCGSNRRPAICMVVLGSADRSSQDEIKANILSAALSSLPTTTFLQVPAS